MTFQHFIIALPPSISCNENLNLCWDIVFRHLRMTGENIYHPKDITAPARLEENSNSYPLRSMARKSMQEFNEANAGGSPKSKMAAHKQ